MKVFSLVILLLIPVLGFESKYSGIEDEIRDLRKSMEIQSAHQIEALNKLAVALDHIRARRDCLHMPRKSPYVL